MPKNSNYTDIMEKNHMEIPWHDYVKNDSFLHNHAMEFPYGFFP